MPVQAVKSLHMKNVIVSCLLLVLTNHLVAQGPNMDRADEPSRSLIKAGLSKLVNPGNRFIAAPMPDNEMIGSIHFYSQTFFLDRLSSSDYCNSTDTAVLHRAVLTAPKFRAPQGYPSDFLISLDTPLTTRAQIQQIQIQKLGVYGTVSGLVFSKAGDKCLVLVHKIHEGGTTFELVKNEGHWQIRSAKQEWIE